MEKLVDPSTLDATKILLVPAWLLWSSFILSILVSAIGVIKTIVRYFTKASLEVRLTRELFFRLSNYGECLFPNIVAIARNGEVEIRDVRFELEKQKNSASSAEKKFHISPIFFGDRIAGKGPFADNNFYTASPLFFIEKSNSKRLVVMAALTEHNTKFSKITEEYSAKIIQSRNQLVSSSTSDDQLKEQMLQSLNNLSTECAGKIMSYLQLDAGKYHLTVIVKYRPLDSFFNIQKECRSSVELTISDQFKEEFSWKTLRLLRQLGTDLILDQTANVDYPEYFPTDVREL